jgi:hypothetical protein
MPEKIGNFSLVIPVEGDIPDIPRDIKALVEDITAKLLGYSQDTIAKRPAAGVSNRIFKATDTGAIYHDTGTEWELVMPGTSGSAYSGFTAKTLAEGHTGFVVHATRDAHVQIKLKSAEATWGAKIEVNGKSAGYLLQGAGGTTISVRVPAGQTLKVDKDEPAGEKLAAGVTLEVSTLLL